MSSQTNQQKRVVNIQFCKNCNTHSWCTHHSQQRYYQLFFKLSKAIQAEFPDVVVKGNEIPKNLVPIKASENKFFDAIKNKYVFFPAIGAFQVSMNGQIIFSKKAINSWPIFQDIVDQISLKIHGKVRQKARNQNDNMTQEDTIALANSYLSKFQNRKTLHRHKNDAFTLSDHFKLYQKGNHKEGSAKDYYAQIQKINKKKLKRNHQNDENSDNNSIGSNSIAQSRSRVKDIELIKKLESIQQQNFTDELKKLTKGPQQGNIQDWNRYLDHLQTKFEKFQQKVTKIEKQNIKMNKISPTLDQTYKCLYKSRNKDENCNSPTKKAQQKLSEKIVEVNQSYKTFLYDKDRIKKLANIQAFLNASQKQKNKVLKKIYGLGKNQQLPSSIKKRFYKKRKNYIKRSNEINNNDFDQNTITQSEQDSSDNNSNGQTSEYSQNSSAMPKGINFNKNKFKLTQQKSQSTNSFGKAGLAKIGSQDQQGKYYKINQSKSELKSHQFFKRPFQKGDQHLTQLKSRVPAQSYENNGKTYKKKQNQLIIKQSMGNIGSNQTNGKSKHYRKKQVQNTQEKYARGQTKSSNKPNKVNLMKQQTRLSFERLTPQTLNQRRNNNQPQPQVVAKSKNFRMRKTQQNNFKKEEKINKLEKTDKSVSKQHKKRTNNNQQKVGSNGNSKVDQNCNSKNAPNRISNSPVIFDQQSHFPNNMQKSPCKQSQKIDLSLSSEAQEFNLINKYKKEKAQLKQLQVLNNREQQSVQEIQSNSNNQIEPQNTKQSLIQQSDNFNALHSNLRQKKQQKAKANLNAGKQQKQKKITGKEEVQKRKCQTAGDFAKDIESQSNYDKKELKTAANRRNVYPEQSGLAVKGIRNFKNWQKCEVSQNKKQERKGLEKNQQLKSIKQKSKQKPKEHQKKKDSGKQLVTNGKIKENKSLSAKQRQKKQQKEKKRIASNQSNSRSILKRSTSQNSDGSLKQQNAVLNRHDTIDENQIRENQNNKIRNSKSSNSSDKKVSFESSIQFQPNQAEQQLPLNNSINGREEHMDSKKTQRKGRQAVKRPVQHNQSIPNEYEQGEQPANSGKYQQSNHTSARKQKSQFLQQGSKYYKINLLSNRNHHEVDPSDSNLNVMTSKRNHNSMIASKKQQNSQRSKSFRSVASNKEEQDKPFRNTPDIVKKIYGQKSLNRSPSAFSLRKSCKLKQRKSLSVRNSVHEYEMANQSDCQQRQAVKRQTKRSVSAIQSIGKKSSKKSKKNASFRQQSKRFSKFKPKKTGTQQSSLSEQQRQNKSMKSKTSRKSGKSKKSKKDELLKINKNSSLINLAKSSKKQKKTGQQKKSSKKKKSKSKKSLKQYALEQNQNPIDNVGTNRAEKSTRKYKKFQMVSIGIQKDEMNQKQIQTEDVNYLSTQQVFRQTKNQNKHFSISKYSKQSRSDVKQNIFGPERQNSPTNFQPQQIRQSSERALLLKQIYGTQLNKEKLKYADILNGNSQIDIQNVQQQLQSEEFIWNSIPNIQADKRKQLFNKKGIKAHLIKSNSQGSSSFRKIVKILAQRNQFLIIRLFENITETQLGFFGVWICDHYRWKCVIVNDLIPVDQSNNPIFSYHEDEQIWASVLQKALAIILGGYKRLTQTSTNKIFHMLTGSNYINFRVREEYQKNNKFLTFLSQNQKKNFIIHAQKLSNCLQQHELAETQTRVYYVLGQKVINDGQVLLRMKQQDKQPFLIKLQKFACQFKNVEILQLRANHNFTCMQVPESSAQSNLSIFQLVFEQPQFGSIALSNLQDSNLKTYLYKEEQQNVLRMIGQAKQKQKKQVFFDCFFQEGKYYIFIQADNKGSLISYFGQGNPRLSLKQKIKQQGLKNDFTEYVPLNAASKVAKQAMPKFMSFNKQNMNQSFGKSYSNFGNSGARTKQGRDKALQDLRIHFVQFLLGTRN